MENRSVNKNSKTILISGASTGIGKETAILFARKGWNVAATMRSIEKGKILLKYPNIQIFKLDVTDNIEINKTIQDAYNIYGSIDVLFNNAGYGLVGIFESMTFDKIKKQFDTNLFGVMNMIKSILPFFRQEKKGTIITTTSMGGLITFPLYSVYHATKWALEGFLESLHYELKPFNVRIKNIEPGPIKTEFENSIDFNFSEYYENYALIAHNNMLAFFKNAITANSVAEIVFKAANDKSFRLRYPVSFTSYILLFLRRILPNNLFFKLIRTQVEKGI